MLDRYSGATIHFVDEKYDSGPILAQRVVPVRADDTPSDLAARVLKEVCFLLISFIQFNSVPMLKKIKICIVVLTSTHGMSLRSTKCMQRLWQHYVRIEYSGGRMVCR